MPTLDLDKLAKICGLLGSDNEHVRATHAKKADQMIRDAGKTWDEVLRPKPAKPTPQAHARPNPFASAGFGFSAPGGMMDAIKLPTMIRALLANDKIAQGPVKVRLEQLAQQKTFTQANREFVYQLWARAETDVTV